jgi:hypothetical protein
MTPDPTIMTKVLDVLVKSRQPKTPREVFSAVGGDARQAQEALTVLIDKGQATVTRDLKVAATTGSPD